MRVGLWDTALKFLSPGPRNDVTDHLEVLAFSNSVIVSGYVRLNVAEVCLSTFGAFSLLMLINTLRETRKVAFFVE